MSNSFLIKTAIFSFLYLAFVSGLVYVVQNNQELMTTNRYGEMEDAKILETVAEIPAASEGAGVPAATGSEDEAGETGVGAGLPASQPRVTDDVPLNFGLGNVNTNYLTIPLPDGVAAADIAIENHYLERKMWIALAGVDPHYYERAIISGNRDQVVSGFFKEGETEGSTLLSFTLDSVYEYRSIMEDGNIYVEFVPPREIYERIIVIDPGYGGSQTGVVAGDLAEKDIALEIALKLKELLDETDMKVYYTRLADFDVDEDKRVRLANEVRADMLIRIEADGDADSAVNGTTAVYNESFFIPRFGSIELANILETEVVTSILGKAIGLVPASAGDYVIAAATIPAAAIRVGYLTNAQEAILLAREDYIEKIAAGIYQAILAAYEGM